LSSVSAVWRDFAVSSIYIIFFVPSVTELGLRFSP
jgi:hypothetical protein